MRVFAVMYSKRAESRTGRVVYTDRLHAFHRQLAQYLLFLHLVQVLCV